MACFLVTGAIKLFSFYLGSLASYSGIYRNPGVVISSVIISYIVGAILVLASEFNVFRVDRLQTEREKKRK